MPTGNHEPDENVETAASSTELAAVEGLVFGTYRRLWIGVATVLVPLVVLLVLQYRWLGDLERDSAIARRSSLEGSLTAVTKETHYLYATIAERTLNLPAELLTDRRLAKIGHVFAGKDLAGIDELFIVVFDPDPTILLYDRRTGSLVEPPATPTTRAIGVAVSPWTTLHTNRSPVSSARFYVDEHDPEHRIILTAIVDETSQLVGIAGLVVDQRFFIEQVLPDAIDVSLPSFDRAEALWVCVRNHLGEQVFPEKACAEMEADHVKRFFSFVFTDWTISLHGRLAAPESWARSNFSVNVTLLTALAVVLLSGVVFTVRTAIREMRLSAMKNEFVSNVSHELRTPLASIRVFGELMRHGRVDDPTKVAEYGSHIEIESRRLTQLINNILDFSRIESGEKVYSFHPSDIEEMLEHSLATFTVRLRDRGLDLEYEPPDGPLPPLWLDTNAMDRAVANLLDNAVKYSADDSRVTVRLEQTDGEVVLSVADRGIGIPPDEQERVFDRFHRVSTAFVHDIKGTGLGLSLVRHIVEAHGGRVTLDSEVGVGSTFAIRLPVGWTPEHSEGGESWPES